MIQDELKKKKVQWNIKNRIIICIKYLQMNQTNTSNNP